MTKFASAQICFQINFLNVPFFPSLPNFLNFESEVGPSDYGGLIVTRFKENRKYYDQKMILQIVCVP